MLKKICVLILVLATLFSLSGCQKKSEIQLPVNFYYRNTEITYGTENGVISPEINEAAGYTENIALINAYLKGSSTDQHHSTFPVGTNVIRLDIQKNHCLIVLNSPLAILSGMDLSIACACITKTICELFEVDTVTISVKNEQLDGNDSITMGRNNLTLLDLTVPENSNN